MLAALDRSGHRSLARAHFPFSHAAKAFIDPISVLLRLYRRALRRPVADRLLTELPQLFNLRGGCMREKLLEHDLECLQTRSITLGLCIIKTQLVVVTDHRAC
ncbi:MAG TPA: hypothetical protein VLC92_13265 [Rhodocyclaceae bacterium]|nr:hypothetical protein [Rhodocyclaceae bacterium]